VDYGGVGALRGTLRSRAAPEQRGGTKPFGRLTQQHNMATPHYNPQRILFLAEGQLGDLLLLTPALRAVKESFPTSFLAVLVVERRLAEPTHAPSPEVLVASHAERERIALGTNPNVDELYLLDRQALRARHGIARLKAERAVIKCIREKKFDTVICTFPEDRFVQWAFAAGANVRVGQKHQALRWLLTHKLDSDKSTQGVLAYYCDLVRLIGANVQSTRTEYPIPPSATQWAETTLNTLGVHPDSRIVAIHPGASGDYKMWPPERFALLAQELSSLGNVVLLVGSSFDRAILEAITSTSRGTVREVHTGASVANLAALLHRAHLCISNDSGPRHLAVAVGTPSLALFRHHHDKEWDVYPHSSRIAIIKGTEACPACPAGVCRDRIAPGEHFGAYCLRQIRVDTVLHRAAEMLREQPKKSTPTPQHSSRIR